MSPKMIFCIYGILLAVGAFIGFNAGSKISLIAGLSSAAVIFLGLYLTKTNAPLGFGIMTGTSGLLVIMFLIRLMKTGKFMPSGMLLALSLIAFIVGIRHFIQK